MDVDDASVRAVLQQGFQTRVSSQRGGPMQGRHAIRIGGGDVRTQLQQLQHRGLLPGRDCEMQGLPPFQVGLHHRARLQRGADFRRPTDLPDLPGLAAVDVAGSGRGRQEDHGGHVRAVQAKIVIAIPARPEDAPVLQALRLAAVAHGSPLAPPRRLPLQNVALRATRPARQRGRCAVEKHELIQQLPSRTFLSGGEEHNSAGGGPECTIDVRSPFQ
mmetsp:Transcript_174097/g.558199  ORF Transcript_174097/g.558199 Transcript_174097/m.558199 type:complete len:217 (-) Transcript_174097:4220-4870(-)